MVLIVLSKFPNSNSMILQDVSLTFGKVALTYSTGTFEPFESSQHKTY